MFGKIQKTGGFCVAGKEIIDKGAVGGWIRPVSSRETEEIKSKECEYENGYQPNLLDIVEIPFTKHKPKCFQCENYLIDDGYYWSKEEKFNSENLSKICDNPDTLWSPHDSSYYGINDRVEECLMGNLRDSLYLITPAKLSVDVQIEGEEFGNRRRKVRARFEYNSEKYLFPITDPIIEKRYLRKREGQYYFENPKNRIFMCVSIGLPYDNYCYKFVASIIEK